MPFLCHDTGEVVRYGKVDGWHSWRRFAGASPERIAKACAMLDSEKYLRRPRDGESFLVSVCDSTTDDKPDMSTLRAFSVVASIELTVTGLRGQACPE
jgi:hypothetical protein